MAEDEITLDIFQAFVALDRTTINMFCQTTVAHAHKRAHV